MSQVLEIHRSSDSCEPRVKHVPEPGSLSTPGKYTCHDPGERWLLIYLARKRAGCKCVSRENVSAETSLLPRPALPPRPPSLRSSPSLSGCDCCAKSAEPQGPRLSVPGLTPPPACTQPSLLAPRPLRPASCPFRPLPPALPTAKKPEVKKK